MANKSFGIKELNLIGSSGAPVIESPTSLSIYATTVAISTDVSIGGKVTSNVIIGNGYSVGIGTTNPTSKLEVQNGDIKVGVNTSQGLILTSPNGTKFRVIVDNAGVLSTVSLP